LTYIVAPKSFEKNVIGSDGKLTSTQTTVYGKNIPIKKVIPSKTKRLHAAGFFNICSDDHYTSYKFEMYLIVLIYMVEVSLLLLTR
jgi:hypothetical protein